MVFARAFYDTDIFEGYVYYRFEEDVSSVRTLMIDYGGSADSYEGISEDEWAEAEGWPMYVAYPDFGRAFIFAIDCDLESEEGVDAVVLSHAICSWDRWAGSGLRL